MSAKIRAAPAKRTQQQRSDAAIDALLGVARKSFGGSGYDGTSLDDVAARAGMTKGAVYHHFGSKHALFEGVFRLEHRRTIDTVVAKSRGARDPIDGLLRGVRAYLQYVLDPVARRILLEDGPSVLGWERWREVGIRYGLGIIEGMLARAVDEGVIPAQPLRATAHVLLSALDEAALYISRAADPDAARRDMYAVCDRLIAGLSAD